MISKLFIFVFIMIFSYIVGFIGIVFWIINPSSPNIGIIVFSTLLGFSSGVWNTIYLFRLNKNYQKNELDKARKIEGEILVEWKDGENEFVITRQSLFVNQKQSCFRSFYEALKEIALVEKSGELYLIISFKSMVIENQPVTRSYNLKIRQEQKAKLQEIVEFLKINYS